MYLKGYNATYSAISATEVLSSQPGEAQWREGPTLPHGVARGQMVQDTIRKSLILLGGTTGTPAVDEELEILDTLLELNLVTGIWTELEKHLSNPRYGHTAFLIPEDIVDCN